MKTNIESYTDLGPSDDALSDYVKYQYVPPPADNRYYLVADFEFFYGQYDYEFPALLRTYDPGHFKRTSGQADGGWCWPKNSRTH